MDIKKRLVIIGASIITTDDPRIMELKAKMPEMEIIHYKNMEPENVQKALKGATFVLTNQTTIGKKELAGNTSVAYIGVVSTGYNAVDTAYARERNILVTNVPNYGTAAVSQFAFGLIMELALRIGDFNREVKDGNWTEDKEAITTPRPMELKGKTLGLFGYGAIGQAVSIIAQGFGMKVIAHSRRKLINGPGDKALYVSFDELLENADFLSIHAPLQEDTKDLFSKKVLLKMKKGAFLINTARGGMVVDKDLSEVVSSGHLGGAGLDVVSKEPIEKDSPLLGQERIILTPHIAWSTKEAAEKMVEIAIGNLTAFIAGSPINQVNK